MILNIIIIINPFNANHDNSRFLIRFTRKLNHNYCNRNVCLNIKIFKCVAFLVIDG